MGLSDRIFNTEAISQEPLKLDKGLSTLAELYGGIAMDKQWSLQDVIGNKSGKINAAKGRIKFGLWHSFPVQILGTYTISSKTFLWAWAATHPFVPSDLIQQALQLKSYGIKNGIGMLSKELFTAEKLHLYLIGSIASGMFDASSYHLVKGKDSITVVSLNGGTIKNKKLTDQDLTDLVIPEWFSWFEMVDERNAINTYLTAKNYEITWEGEEMVARLGKDEIRAVFDGERKLVSFS
ncbi:DUF6882 domain-containing protein [Chitinophaga sp.]|uniref:DUF6882 domain-containing protein n=1 Tax=Chitinophaga sp. TaxID=1869181 RepID=UPI002F935491